MHRIRACRASPQNRRSGKIFVCKVRQRASALALAPLAASKREELEPEVLVDAGLCVATGRTQHSAETLVAQLLPDVGAVELALFTSALELDETHLHATGSGWLSQFR